MTKLIDKDALVAEIKRRMQCYSDNGCEPNGGKWVELISIKHFLDTLEVKEVDLMIHTIIAECCDWLAVHTELNHEQIEDCRNLMLTVKDKQLKAKG